MAFAAALGLSEDQVGVAYGIVVAFGALLLLCCGSLYYCYARDRLRRRMQPKARPIMTKIGSRGFRLVDAKNAQAGGSSAKAMLPAISRGRARRPQRRPCCSRAWF